jgi:hypothetical protein
MALPPASDCSRPPCAGVNGASHRWAMGLATIDSSTATRLAARTRGKQGVGVVSLGQDHMSCVEENTPHVDYSRARSPPSSLISGDAYSHVLGSSLNCRTGQCGVMTVVTICGRSSVLGRAAPLAGSGAAHLGRRLANVVCLNVGVEMAVSAGLARTGPSVRSTCTISEPTTFADPVLSMLNPKRRSTRSLRPPSGSPFTPCMADQLGGHRQPVGRDC